MEDSLKEKTFNWKVVEDTDRIPLFVFMENIVYFFKETMHELEAAWIKNNYRGQVNITTYRKFKLKHMNGEDYDSMTDYVSNN